MIISDSSNHHVHSRLGRTYCATTTAATIPVPVVIFHEINQIETIIDFVLNSKLN